MDMDIASRAELAYARFCDGFLNGVWDPFFELVADQAAARTGSASGPRMTARRAASA